MRTRRTEPGQPTSSINRYDRQELIEGWDQDRLSRSRVVVIGSDILANYTALTLSALGFGNIEIYGSGCVNRDGQDFSGGFLYYDSQPGSLKTEAISDFARKLNPHVNSLGLSLDMAKKGNIRIIGLPDIIIEATNNISSKLNVVGYAKDKHIPLLSISSAPYISALGAYLPSQESASTQKLLDNMLFSDMNEERQGTYTSQVISGIAVEEARKIIMPLRNEKTLEDIIVYNLLSSARFDWNIDKSPPDNDLSSRKVLMIGAGALGNFSGLGLALNNIGRLYIADFDTVEETNLNRQILFYNSVGEKKAMALASELGRINPRCRFEYIDTKITPSTESLFKDMEFDLVIDCVDNNPTRALLNYFSMRYGFPFISGGTRFSSGQVTVSIPHKTACLNCQAGIDELAISSYRPASCIYAPEPSVINSNQVVGGMIVGEVINTLAEREPARGILKYSSQEELRLGLLPTNETCNCYTDKKMLKNWMEKMRHLYT